MMTQSPDSFSSCVTAGAQVSYWSEADDLLLQQSQQQLLDVQRPSINVVVTAARAVPDARRPHVELMQGLVCRLLTAIVVQ